MNQSLALISDYFLHAPWWVAGLIALVGIGLFFTANRRQDATLRRVAIAIFSIGVILGVLGQLFPSEREKLERRTRHLVSATSKSDWASLSSLLDANTTLASMVDTPRGYDSGTSGGSLAIAVGRTAIVAAVKDAMQRFSVTAISVTGVQVEQTDTLITVYIQVLSRQDATQDRPIPSSWQLDFQQSDNDWVLQRITLTHVGVHDQSFGPFSQ